MDTTRSRTANVLDRFRARLTLGTDLAVIAHDVPERAGNRYRLLKVQRETAKVTWVNHDAPTPSQHVWIQLPTRVRDVEWLDDDTVRVWLSKPEVHVTYRFLADDAPMSQT